MSSVRRRRSRAAEKRVRGWLADGTLVRPGSRPDTADLACGLYSLAGARGLRRSRAASRLARRIGRARQYVLVLIDGLGSEMLQSAPEGGFLRTHVSCGMLSVWPSTTAAALTTLATAERPGRHGVTGWWIYLRERGISTTVLPFVERFTERDLRELGVSPGEVFTAPPVAPRLKATPVLVVPAEHVGSVYTSYVAGGAAVEGYRNPAEGVELVARRLRDSRGRTYTYLYLPQVDSLCHDHGPGAEPVTRMLRSLDGLIGGMLGGFAESARIVVTGDHGLIGAPPESAVVLDEGDEIESLLVAPPAGDPRAPVFHVREGRSDEFREAFASRAGGLFELLAADEVEALRLMGPGRLSPVTRRRLGTFVGISRGAATLWHRPKGGEVAPHRGVHAGLSRAEMEVPLILA